MPLAVHNVLLIRCIHSNCTTVSTKVTTVLLLLLAPLLPLSQFIIATVYHINPIPRPGVDLSSQRASNLLSGKKDPRACGLIALRK